MAIKEDMHSLMIDIKTELYSIKRECTKKGDSCTECPFQTDKGCEMKRITGTYPISWKELKDGEEA